MKLKEISKDIYDVDAWLDEELGKEGTPEREASIEKAWEEYNGQILLDARKNARLTQEELANRIGADKSYISKIERGLITAGLGSGLDLQSSERSGADRPLGGFGGCAAHPDHHRRCDYQRQRGHYGRVSAVSAGGVHPFGE